MFYNVFSSLARHAKRRSVVTWEDASQSFTQTSFNSSQPGWTCDRLKRIQQRPALYQESINEVADVLDNHRINSVDAYNARCQEYHQMLNKHRRQVVHLKKQQGVISKEKECNAKCAKLAKDERDQRAVAEVESHQQATIARHETEASIKSPESRAYEYIRTDASKGVYIYQRRHSNLIFELLARLLT
jgi:hypothetical protein